MFTRAFTVSFGNISLLKRNLLTSRITCTKKYNRSSNEIKWRLAYFWTGDQPFSANFWFKFQKGIRTPSTSEKCHSPQPPQRAATTDGCGRNDGAAELQDRRWPRMAARAANEELPVGAPAPDRRAAGQALAEEGRARVHRHRRGCGTALGCRAAGRASAWDGGTRRRRIAAPRREMVAGRGRPRAPGLIEPATHSAAY